MCGRLHPALGACPGSKQGRGVVAVLELPCRTLWWCFFQCPTPNLTPLSQWFCSPPPSLSSAPAHAQLLVSALVGIWTLRRGTFWVQRIHKAGEVGRVG